MYGRYVSILKQNFYSGDGPVPLTQIPANCGLSMTQGPTDAGFTVDYQGCHVTQEVCVSIWTDYLSVKVAAMMIRHVALLSLFWWKLLQNNVWN